MKILLATDGSAYSKAAVEEIARKPFPPNTEVYVISVYELYSLLMATRLPFGGDAKYYSKLDAEARDTAEEAVKDAVKTLKEENTALLVSWAAIEGAPKEVILKEAEKFGADIIVVGSQGRGAISRFLLGSVSQAVALHASCSVEIVRKHGN